MRTIILAAIVLIIFVVSGCNDYKLPAVGQVIYCPSCDADLYIRKAGTSRTMFRRAEYCQARFNFPVPEPGFYTFCPLCQQSIVEQDANGDVIRVYYRDRSERNAN